MEGLFASLLVSLLLTEALEIPFCIAAWRFRGREIGVCALVNVVTNPPVVLMYHVIRQGLSAGEGLGFMPLFVLALELGAVAAEWLFYRSCTDKKHPFLISLTANAFSYLAGLALSSLI